MAAASRPPVKQVMEQLLRRNKRLQLPDNWFTLTPEQLKLDSLDLVELQLEIESSCDIELFGDHVIDSPLNKLTLQALAAHIDTLVHARSTQ